MYIVIILNLLELTCFSILTILTDCGFNRDKWYEFGACLKVPSEKRKSLKEIPDTFEILEEMLEWWITNDEQASWDSLISAVERCSGQKETADKMKRKLSNDTSDAPNSSGTKYKINAHVFTWGSDEAMNHMTKISMTWEFLIPIVDKL